MVDLHTHILPQMDDGSKSAEQTAQMLEELSQQGVSLVVATPHFYANKESPQDFLKRRAEAFAKVKAVPQRMKILLGAEVAYFGGMSNCEDLKQLGISGSRLILIEMPFTPWGENVLREIVAIRQQLGLTPVLAHIDRYRRLPDFWQKVQMLLSHGVLLQCNAEALCSFWGSRRLLNMLADEQIRFLGSDCHNMTSRRPNLKKAVEKIEKTISPKFFAQFDETALAAVNALTQEGKRL